MTNRSASKVSETGFDLDALFGGPDRPKVLIIDDEPDTVTLLKEVIKTAGFDVSGALSCKEALEKTASFSPDVILLDLMMPDVDGWQTFERLRKITRAPVLVISARAAKEDVVTGLESGVDDYITKPFHNAEVVARVRNVLRRSGVPERTNRLVFDQIGLIIHLDSKEVQYHGRTHYLTAKEFALFELLARKAPGLVTYEMIANKIWSANTPAAHNRIKYLIYLLRRKLEQDPARPVLILNSGRVGYRLQTEFTIGV